MPTQIDWWWLSRPPKDVRLSDISDDCLASDRWGHLGQVYVSHAPRDHFQAGQR